MAKVTLPLVLYMLSILFLAYCILRYATYQNTNPSHYNPHTTKLAWAGVLSICLAIVTIINFS